MDGTEKNRINGIIKCIYIPTWPYDMGKGRIIKGVVIEDEKGRHYSANINDFYEYSNVEALKEGQKVSFNFKKIGDNGWYDRWSATEILILK